MSGRQGHCRQFSSNGRCKFGDKCKFLHDRSTPSRTGTPGSSSRSQTPQPSSSVSSRPTGASNAPPQVCNFFWNDGSCSRGFDCTFRHMRKPTTTVTTQSSQPVNDTPPDFFSTEGLLLNNGTVREERFSLDPSEAHNQLRPFLRDNYRFESPARIQGFVRILASVNDSNKSWDTENAQSFLGTIVQGNALLRISDILAYTPVRSDIGFGSEVLSFQRGYFPVLQFFSSDLNLKTTLHKNVNLLYTAVLNNFDAVSATVRECVGNMMQAKTWKDPTRNLTPMLQNSLDGVTVFRTLSIFLLQFMNRFKDAARNHPSLVQLINELQTWFDQWTTGICANPPTFIDSTTDNAVRRLTIDHLREDIERLREIVDRETRTLKGRAPANARLQLSPEQRRQALIARLEMLYDPPGTLRPDGPRHNNDFEDIVRISIAPTQSELLSPTNPYLPAFIGTAQHHKPMHSMERHLDIQFRLLREELIATVRSSVVVVSDDVTTMFRPDRNQKKEQTKLEALLAKNGGAYKTSGLDSVFFQIYTNVEFAGVQTERRLITVGLSLDAPAGPARDSDSKRRQEFWKHSKRLQSGSLVALMVVTSSSLRVLLGEVVSFGNDVAETAKHSKDRVTIKVAFFDTEVEYMALRKVKLGDGKSTFAFLLDNGVMYESIRPFLRRMQTIEPTDIPFYRYISHCGDLHGISVDPPKYSRAPGFQFNLQCLAKPGHRIPALIATSPVSVMNARRYLLRSSQLDPSQGEAVVDSLTREISLIQGPPGTGKSFTAKEILRVLFSSGIKPIVLIAFTNHALDHMLTSILDANITNKLVRIGSRSSDERISEYTLDKLEREANSANLDRSARRQYGMMKRIEEEITELMDDIQLPTLTWDRVRRYLEIQHPEQSVSISQPPYWISELFQRMQAEGKAKGEWTDVGKKGKKVFDAFSGTVYGFWKSGRDLAFLQPPASPTKGKGKKVEKSVAPTVAPEVIEFFNNLGFRSVPPLPSTNREIRILEDVSTLWSFSLQERVKLSAQWEQEIRQMAYDSHMHQYEALRKRYKAACEEYNDIKDESRRRLLSQTDLIGCTTTGAAKITSLLSTVSPKVLMVEEAGQVLEAHILTNLVPSVHHVICIGDPQQLRPNIANFALSMESERGRTLFKFDRSLMERLADSGFPMSQINVQRRMRPEISHFIRTILYPNLSDHRVVESYPRVVGMQKDVYFLTHTNKENGSDDGGVSKFNMFEVEMIRDLVLYFLKQGRYSEPGDIAVLCAYLGQLQKVKAALRDLKIAVSVDERDEVELARQGLVDEAEFEQVVVAKHIRLGTVDIFQGQEAKIVIVSLVRNTGAFETGSASIGFLKSSNRINVALSRAKHGLYILGNASNLRKNTTWSTIVDELESREQIGTSLPIICSRHPDQKQSISKPGDLQRFSPGGGCLLPCDARLPCGHGCPSSCHLDLDNHRSMKCYLPCNRTPCPRRHPCPKTCSEDCGLCEFPIYNVQLPCGHNATKVPCYMLEDLDNFFCSQKVSKKLPYCEHSATMSCGQDPARVVCNAPCQGILLCCGKTCKSTCSSCLSTTLPEGIRSTKPIARTKHVSHPCERILKCQHLCGLSCHPKDESCNPLCQEKCRQQCIHHSCPKPCSDPCAPCMEPCAWTCAHKTCPVLCGSICTRLPCDEPCKKLLPCGHGCPSVCGEPCFKQQCISCLPDNRKDDIVDFIMQRRLSEIDLASEDVADRLIRLDCGHVFTVETLDGHCEMNDYYEIDPMGHFVALKAPPIKYQTPPVCPQCRGSITAFRYGRVTKRATLDILEQNVAASMSRSLNQLEPAMAECTGNISEMQTAAKQLPAILDISSGARDKTSKVRENEPLPYDLLQANAMHSIHGLALEEARGWCKLTKTILQIYRDVVKVAGTRGAHVKAYEAALATLYRMEIANLTSDPVSTSTAPEQQAMENVNLKIGQPPYKADTRFQTEAFFVSLELRFTLSEIVFVRIEGLPLISDDEAVVRHRELWCSFNEFLLQSCIDDSRKAFLITKRSSATRQAARSSLYGLRAEFEKARFALICERNNCFRSGRFTQEDRKRLVSAVREKKKELQVNLNYAKQDYVRNRPAKTTVDLRKEYLWFEDNCAKKVEQWYKACDDLEQFMMKDGVYIPLSLQEREDIVRAFGSEFTHRGHFYNCENGHTFVITECGGAMQTARCPECHAPIGGNNHQLHSSNTRATEFETIARRQGGLDAPWPWGRGA